MSAVRFWIGTPKERPGSFCAERLTDAATDGIVECLEGVVSGGRTRDRKTVERMAELLYAHANVGDLIGEPAGADEE